MYLRKHFVESGFRQHAAQGFDRLRKLVFVAVKGVCLAQAEALPAVDHDRLPAPRLRVQVNREFAQLRHHFLLNNGMAMAVTKTFPVDEAVYNLFTNPGRIENIRKVMALVAHPDATEKLVAHVLSHGTPERETFIPEMPAE